MHAFRDIFTKQCFQVHAFLWPQKCPKKCSFTYGFFKAVNKSNRGLWEKNTLICLKKTSHLEHDVFGKKKATDPKSTPKVRKISTKKKAMYVVFIFPY